MEAENRLRKIVAEHLGLIYPSELRSDTNLHEIGMDSLDRVEIQMEVEDAFGIDRIPDADMKRVATFGDLVRVVERLPK